MKNNEFERSSKLLQSEVSSKDNTRKAFTSVAKEATSGPQSKSKNISDLSNILVVNNEDLDQNKINLKGDDSPIRMPLASPKMQSRSSKYSPISK